MRSFRIVMSEVVLTCAVGLGCVLCYVLLHLYPTWTNDSQVKDCAGFSAFTIFAYGVARVVVAILVLPFRLCHRVGYLIPSIKLLFVILCVGALPYYHYYLTSQQRLQVLQLVETHLLGKMWKDVFETQYPSMLKELHLFGRLFGLLLAFQVGLQVLLLPYIMLKTLFYGRVKKHDDGVSVAKSIKNEKTKAE